MGPHSERDNLQPAATAAPSADLDFDLDVDTQIDVFVLSPDADLPLAFERDAAPASTPRPAAPN